MHLKSGSFTGQTSQNKLPKKKKPRNKKCSANKVSTQPVLATDAIERTQSNAPQGENEAAEHTSVKSKSCHRKVGRSEEERRERRE